MKTLGEKLVLMTIGSILTYVVAILLFEYTQQHHDVVSDPRLVKKLGLTAILDRYESSHLSNIVLAEDIDETFDNIAGLKKTKENKKLLLEFQVSRSTKSAECSQTL